jgi:predicted dehydrogenase
MKPTDPIRRREVLAASAAAAAVTIVPRHVLGGPGQTPPSEKLNLAGVGVGAQGGWDLRQLAGQNIVALADVDWDYAARTFKEHPQARKYKDFRKMLDEEKSIDAVVIGTPDHNHAVVTMAAMKRGKHVYCEKPLTRTVHEARAVTLAARETKVATQMGNQGMASEGNRLINEWIMDGAIGQVREVHVWTDRPTRGGNKKLFWPQGVERPTDRPPVPATLDWDVWLGPAPWRPYNPAYVPFRWRGWWDFGSGGLGDMGIHNIAPVFSALDLHAPTSIYASSTPVYEETLPMASIVHYEFPARGSLPPVTLHWYDGGLLPPRPPEFEEGLNLVCNDAGVIFVGDKGKMFVEGEGGRSPRLIPDSRMRDYKRPSKSLPRSIGHHKEWVEACKGRGTTRSNFDFAGPLTEAVLLGTLCVRLGGHKLNWDTANLKFTNSDAANALINPPYRQGWSL